MKTPSPQEWYFIMVVGFCCIISSGLTYCGVKGIYSQVRQEDLRSEVTDNVSRIMLVNRLQKCSYAFGLYISSKGKHGREYYEESD